MVLTEKTEGLWYILSAGAQPRDFQISQMTLHVYARAEEMNPKRSSAIQTCTADN